MLNRYCKWTLYILGCVALIANNYALAAAAFAGATFFAVEQVLEGKSK